MSAARNFLKRQLAARAPDLLVATQRLVRLRRQRDAEDSEAVIREQFRSRVGEPLDLERPRGLSEKLNSLKLRGATPLQVQCADKIRVRDYVSATVGEHILVPLIFATYRLSDITPDRIPQDRFVLKTNHDHGGVVLCRGRASFDWIAARLKLADHLATNQWSRHREPVYRDIRPGVLAETFLEADGPDGLGEHKVFCFHGEPAFIMAIREVDGVRSKTLFDPEWRRLPVKRRRAPAFGGPLPRPERLNEILEIAAALAAPFTFSRIDLYEAGGALWFGEITFFPEGGLDVFDPPEWELRFGERLDLDAAGGSEARDAVG